MLRGVTFWGNNRSLFRKNKVFRLILQARVNMVTSEDFADRLEKRAIEAEETISLLKSQLLFLQKAAGL